MTDLEKSLEQERWLAVAEAEEATKELYQLRQRCAELSAGLREALRFDDKGNYIADKMDMVDTMSITCDELAEMAKGE